MKRLLAATILMLGTSAAQAALMGAAPEPVRVRGTIAAGTPTTLTLTDKAGRKQVVSLKPDYKVASLTLIGIDQIKQGSFIGTAAMAQKDGTLRATEVHVFAPAMRGLGEGHRAWDGGKDSSMTNGNVDTVGTIAGAKGRTMTVSYNGGKQSIVVPEAVPIVGFEPGTPALLVKGAHVFAITVKGADGKLVAGSVVVGKNGLVPPM